MSSARCNATARRGYEIAQKVEALRELAPIIRAHHERLNGSGYPDGLVGEQIPLLARIIAVADTWDAMVSVRPYRVPLTHAEAVTELRRVSGSELDPRCVAGAARRVRRRSTGSSLV